MFRQNVSVSQEVTDLIIADAALTIAFAILLGGGIGAQKPNCTNISGIFAALCGNAVLFFLPIAFVAVTLSFVLHEYMHKIVAQRYGAIAAFRRSDMGIVISLVTSLFGFLLALPGATMIYTNSFTREQDGYVSLAGPLTNLVVFSVFFIILIALPAGVTSGYIGAIVTTTLFIALWLAFVNMLPIYPLDGSKVLRWNKLVYAVVLITVIGLLLFVVGPSISLLLSIGFVLVLSLILSFSFRSILFR